MDPLSCRTMKAHAVRLQLHALAYNLANFLRTLVLPDEMECWSLTTLQEKVVNIGTKVVGHPRYTVFQMAEVAAPRDLFRRFLELTDATQCMKSAAGFAPVLERGCLAPRTPLNGGSNS